MRNRHGWCGRLGGVLLLALVPVLASAQSPQPLDPDATRYIALGDSIAAGYKAVPQTQAYPYLLVDLGVFGRMPHTLFCNAAVPGSTSRDVLLHQTPLALIPVPDAARASSDRTGIRGGDRA